MKGLVGRQLHTRAARKCAATGEDASAMLCRLQAGRLNRVTQRQMPGRWQTHVRIRMGWARGTPAACSRRGTTLALAGWRLAGVTRKFRCSMRLWWARCKSKHRCAEHGSMLEGQAGAASSGHACRRNRHLGQSLAKQADHSLASLLIRLHLCGHGHVASSPLRREADRQPLQRLVSLQLKSRSHFVGAARQSTAGLTALDVPEIDGIAAFDSGEPWAVTRAQSCREARGMRQHAEQRARAAPV